VCFGLNTLGNTITPSPNKQEAPPPPTTTTTHHHHKHTRAQQVEKEKDALRLELTKARSQIGEAGAAISLQRAELDKLKAVVVEADAERLRQKKEYDLVGAGCVCGGLVGCWVWV